MKKFTEFLMVICFMWVGLWIERSTNYFSEGNIEGGWWSFIPVVVFTFLGAWNLAIVKLDAKKEAK